MRLVLLFFSLSLLSFSQTVNNYILWDVTWSMKGYCYDCPNQYDSEGDIWDETKKILIEQVENIPLRPDYNVTLVPFEDLADVTGYTHVIKSYMGFNKENQQDLINFIKNYEGSPKEQMRNTNICAVLDYSFDLIRNSTSSDDQHQILLHTDGKQSVEPRSCVQDKLKEFCNWCRIRETSKTLYWLDLKPGQNTDLNLPCECVKKPLPGVCSPPKNVVLRAPASLSVLYEDLQENNNLIEISFESLVLSVPDDFNLTVSSNNTQVSILSSSYSDDNKLTLSMDYGNIMEGDVINTTLSFSAVSADECYNFEITDLNLKIIRQKLKIVEIGNILPLDK